MGGSAATWALRTVADPLAAMTEVVKSPSHGLSAMPGRHSHTVPAASLRGTVVVEAGVVVWLLLLPVPPDFPAGPASLPPPPPPPQAASATISAAATARPAPARPRPILTTAMW